MKFNFVARNFTCKCKTKFGYSNAIPKKQIKTGRHTYNGWIIW